MKKLKVDRYVHFSKFDSRSNRGGFIDYTEFHGEDSFGCRAGKPLDVE